MAWVSSPRLLGDVGVRVSDLGTTPREGGPGIAGSEPGPRITLPAIRRALQGFLRPRAKPDCDYCNPYHHLLTQQFPILTE